MAVKVAINGFGRIGRLAFRQMFGAEGYEVVAINDLTSPKMLAHLLKYDSSQGKYALADTVSATDDSIIVDGKEIKIYAKADASELPWGELKVDVVLECTGFYTSKEKASAHIKAGARKVVISAPAGNDLPTIVYNVNHETLKAEDTVISAASCTTNCLAPMAKALNDFAPIQSGIMCTIHAYTGDQMTLDGPQRKGDLRRSRAAAVNIVPNSTGAAKAIGLVSEVYPAEELMDKAMELANAICANAQIAVCESKRCIRMGMQTDIHTGSAFEAEAFGVTCGTEDKNEGMGAFLEKRAEKHFQNR